MNLREDDQVSAVALVMETTADTGAEVQEELRGRRARPTPDGQPPELASRTDVADEEAPRARLTPPRDTEVSGR